MCLKLSAILYDVCIAESEVVMSLHFSYVRSFYKTKLYIVELVVKFTVFVVHV